MLLSPNYPLVKQIIILKLAKKVYFFQFTDATETPAVPPAPIPGPAAVQEPLQAAHFHGKPPIRMPVSIKFTGKILQQNLLFLLQVYYFL